MSGSPYWGATWTCIEGCTKCSPGCANCFALAYARRFTGHPKSPCYGLVKNGEWTGEVRCREDRLTVPLRWKDPRVIFVDIRSDTFHPDVPFEFIDRMFAVMALCPQHTFLICTKRAERMAEYWNTDPVAREATINMEGWKLKPRSGHSMDIGAFVPIPNVWLGVTVENQAAADERIPHLLRCPAAVRWVSAEPLLGGLEFSRWMGDGQCDACGWRGFAAETVDLPGYGWPPDDDNHEEGLVCPACNQQKVATLAGTALDCLEPGIDWVATGGETGPGARPCDVEHIRGVVQQCKAANVRVWVKQRGSCRIHDVPIPGSRLLRRPYAKRGDDMSEWPEDMRVRERPEVTRG